MAGALKVLIVDDDPITLEVMSELLSGEGCEVHVRERALGTTVWMLSERPDMVLVDVHMPGLGGDAIVDVARQRMGKGAPSFVLMSSMPQEELARLANRNGALGYLCKDGNQAAMVERFRELLELHRARP